MSYNTNMSIDIAHDPMQGSEGKNTLDFGTDSDHGLNVYASDNPIYGDKIRHVAEEIRTKAALNAGRLKTEDLEQDGIFRDEFSEASKYYVVDNTGKMVASRQIYAETINGGINGLPTLRDFDCDLSLVAKVAGVDDMRLLKPSEVVEISALSSVAKNGSVDGDSHQTELQATPFLYASMLRNSVEEGHKLWIANLPPWLSGSIGAMIGRDKIVQIGPAKEYWRETSIPVALNPNEIIKSVLTSEDPYMSGYKEYICQAFEGIDISMAQASIIEEIKSAGITTKS